jgi:hypothetical protein
MAYFSDNGYLERIPWSDGTRVFCKGCDSQQPMAVRGKMLRCPQGHQTHPAQAIATGELAR